MFAQTPVANARSVPSSPPSIRQLNSKLSRYVAYLACLVCLVGKSGHNCGFRVANGEFGEGNRKGIPMLNKGTT